MRKTLLLVVAASAMLTIPGCGSTSNDATSGAAASASAAPTDNTAPSADVTAVSTVNACDALTPAQVAAVLGRPATGEGFNSGSTEDAYQLDACVWGQVTDGTVLSLQLFTPGALADPLSILLTAAGTTPTPVPSLPSGKYYDTLGLLPGGGGVGATITWQQGNQQAALSLAGGTPGPDAQATLTTAAQQANQAL